MYNFSQKTTFARNLHVSLNYPGETELVLNLLKGNVTGNVNGQNTEQLGQESNAVKALIVCLSDKHLPKTEILKALNMDNMDKSMDAVRKDMERNYLYPAIAAGLVAMTIPEKPKSTKQAYYLTEKGKRLYQQLKAQK